MTDDKKEDIRKERVEGQNYMRSQYKLMVYVAT